MSEYIPFVTGEDGCKLASKIFSDSEAVRIPLHRVDKFGPLCSKKSRLWLDPSIDGLHDLPHALDKTWGKFIAAIPSHEKIASSNATTSEVEDFVNKVLDRCMKEKANWISVPQLPQASDWSCRIDAPCWH
jgi:hypothetical protein